MNQIKIILIAKNIGVLVERGGVGLRKVQADAGKEGGGAGSKRRLGSSKGVNSKATQRTRNRDPVASKRAAN